VERALEFSANWTLDDVLLLNTDVLYYEALSFEITMLETHHLFDIKCPFVAKGKVLSVLVPQDSEQLVQDTHSELVRKLHPKFQTQLSLCLIRGGVIRKVLDEDSADSELIKASESRNLWALLPIQPEENGHTTMEDGCYLEGSHCEPDKVRTSSHAFRFFGEPLMIKVSPTESVGSLKKRLRAHFRDEEDVDDWNFRMFDLSKFPKEVEGALEEDNMSLEAAGFWGDYECRFIGMEHPDKHRHATILRSSEKAIKIRS